MHSGRSPALVVRDHHAERPVLASPAMYERPGYRTLIGRIRENVRTYIRKQIELPKQEILEIVRANLVAVIAIWLPLPLAALIVTLLLLGGTALAGWLGYKNLDIRGPTRSIESFKETVSWAKARLLGRSES